MPFPLNPNRLNPVHGGGGGLLGGNNNGIKPGAIVPPQQVDF